MATPKKFLHDKVALALLSANGFLVVLSALLVLLRLDASRSGGYIVQYRANLGISAYKGGGGIDLLSFAVFSVVVCILFSILAWRIYVHKRAYGLLILCMASILLILSIIISNALLVLR